MGKHHNSGANARHSQVVEGLTMKGPVTGRPRKLADQSPYNSFSHYHEYQKFGPLRAQNSQNSYHQRLEFVKPELRLLRR